MTAPSRINEPDEALDQDHVAHLSYSRINRYLTCPEQYRLYYVERLRPRIESAGLVFGALVHVALADLFRNGTDPTATFLTEWQNLKDVELDYGKKESWQSLKDKGEKLLQKFLKEEAPKIRKVFGVERKFELAVTSLSQPFVGIVDLLSEVDGQTTIVDFKTANADYEEHTVALSDQLTAYFLGEPEARKVALCVLVKTKEPRIEWHISRRNASHLAEYLDKVRIVAEDIARGKFYKRPGKWCSYCDFLAVCLGDKQKARRSW
jgi:CRISPR/Cas system-associated exonuclease Cas4 (RecB family)